MIFISKILKNKGNLIFKKYYQLYILKYVLSFILLLLILKIYIILNKFLKIIEVDKF